MAHRELHTLMGDYPHTLALKRGEVSSPRVKLKFADVKVPHEAFKRVIAGEFDVAELAIMTYLQARAYGKPFVALPVVLHARFQHSQIAYNANRGVLAPKDIEGRRVGLRTYSQTTPTWVRGILQNDFGVELDRVNWITFDAGHVPEFHDPPNALRAAPGKALLPMLLAGELDAAVVGAPDPKYPDLQPLIPNPDDAARAWHERTGAIQVNHILVVKESLAQTDPDAVCEIYRMMAASKDAEASETPEGLDTQPIGYSANRRNFELAADQAWQQKIIPRQLFIDELFDNTTRALDREPAKSGPHRRIN